MWNTIRKFGLDYCDLPTMLWNVSVMLRALTLNIDPRYTKPIPALFYIITLTVAFSYFYVYLFSMCWFVFWRCRETGDLITAIVVWSLGFSSEIGTLKLIYMYIYRRKVIELTSKYLDCDSLVIAGSRFSEKLLEVLRRVKKRAMLFWLVIIGNGVVYVMKPIVMPGRHLMEDSFVLYGLEPSFQSPNYEMSFLLMTGGVVFTVYLPANITAFLIIIIGYTEAQMLALTEEITHIWSDANKHYRDQSVTYIRDSNDLNVELENNEARKKIVNEYIKNRLNRVIKIHTINIDLMHKVEHIFRGAMAIEFMLLMIGLIVELLGGLENTYMEVPFAFMQVAMDCLTGQRVMDASLAFEKAVYGCKWENFDVANMKTVQLMLINSQRTIKLSAGGVTTLSFSSLMNVVKSIYSAYTTLRTTMDNNRT